MRNTQNCRCNCVCVWSALDSLRSQRLCCGYTVSWPERWHYACGFLIAPSWVYKEALLLINVPVWVSYWWEFLNPDVFDSLWLIAVGSRSEPVVFSALLVEFITCVQLFLFLVFNEVMATLGRHVFNPCKAHLLLVSIWSQCVSCLHGSV